MRRAYLSKASTVDFGKCSMPACFTIGLMRECEDRGIAARLQRVCPHSSLRDLTPNEFAKEQIPISISHYNGAGQ
jgi:hypothetical protein